MGVRYRRIDYRYTVSSRGSFPAPLRTAPAFWRPAADLIESASAVEVTVEVPGVSEDDIEVTLFENAVVVEGVRHPPSGPPDCRFYAAEIRYGPFRLEVDIPGTIDAEHITATYSAGMLHLRVPRSFRGAGR